MMGTRSLALLSLLLLVATTSACCGPAAELVPVGVERTPVEIAGGYSLGRPFLSGLELYGKAHECYDAPGEACYSVVIEEGVAEIGWSEEYIVGERHPRKRAILASPDTPSPVWFVIAIESNAVYKDLSHEEFAKLIGDLGIPNIEMRDARDVYHHK